MKLSELPDDIIGRKVYYVAYGGKIASFDVSKIIIESQKNGHKNIVYGEKGAYHSPRLNQVFLSETDAILDKLEEIMDGHKKEILTHAAHLKKFRAQYKEAKAQKLIEQLAGIDENG